MRRKDRQIIDTKKIEEIFTNADCCRLGLVDDRMAYIVPLSFGFMKENGKMCLYFHSSPKGKKIDLIQRSGKASFEVDVNYSLKQEAQACEFSCYYQSVIGYGAISVLTDEQETLHALRCVMEHYTGKYDWEINPKMMPVVVGIKLEIEEMTAKENQPSIK